MKIVTAQLNYHVGNIVSNTYKIIEVISDNDFRESDIIVFSELCLFGYYPKDMIYMEEYMLLQEQGLQKIIERTSSPLVNAAVVIGVVEENDFAGKPFRNALYFIHNGEVKYKYYKQLLPTYGIFDEARHFEAGTSDGFIEFNGKRIGFLICEDAWEDPKDKLYVKNDPVVSLMNARLDLVISINASPSNLGKQQERLDVIKHVATTVDAPVVYVNQVGGNDDLVFDGGSMVYDKHGLIDQSEYFVEDVRTIDLSENQERLVPRINEKYDFILKQLVLGVQDYCSKCGFNKVVIGSSGGVDSALTMAIASIALGGKNVKAITMPTQYSSKGSVGDSVDLCNNLGIDLIEYPIGDVFTQTVENYANNITQRDFYDKGDGYFVFQNVEESMSQIANENLQARIRGTILMTYSNSSGALVLSTGNKSELAVGYCTLYGDMNGGLSVLGDLYKTEVFKLCRHINDNYFKKEMIPNAIIDKPPSAELAEDQQDTDSLPPYDVLDAILRLYIEKPVLPMSEIMEAFEVVKGIEEADEDIKKKVIGLVNRNEYKRNQSPPIIRLTRKSFGFDRQMPLSGRYIK